MFFEKRGVKKRDVHEPGGAGRAIKVYASLFFIHRKGLQSVRRDDQYREYNADCVTYSETPSTVIVDFLIRHISLGLGTIRVMRMLLRTVREIRLGVPHPVVLCMRIIRVPLILGRLIVVVFLRIEVVLGFIGVPACAEGHGRGFSVVGGETFVAAEACDAGVGDEGVAVGLGLGGCCCTGAEGCACRARGGCRVRVVASCGLVVV